MSNTPHQLARKTNDSHSRTADYQNHRCPNNNKITNGSPSHVPSKTKPSPSVFQFDLLHPIPNLVSHSSRKRKPSCSSKDFRPVELSPLKLVPKEPPKKRNQIHLNITTHFKPVINTKTPEKVPQVVIRKQIPWESIRTAFRPNQSTKTGAPSDPIQPRGQIRTLQTLKPVSPLSVAKPNQPQQISSPLKTVWVPKKTPDKRPKVDLNVTALEPLLRVTKPKPSIRPLDTSALLANPILFHKNQSNPLTVSPPNKKRNRNQASGELFNRAKKVIDADQSSLRIWQSDLEAGASLRGTKTRKFQVLQVFKEKGTQIFRCTEFGNHQSMSNRDQIHPHSDKQEQNVQQQPPTWQIFLRGGHVCKEKDKIKLFYPWTELDKNIIISNRFIVL